MAENEKDYSKQAQLIINKKEREIEAAKESVKAFERKIKQFHKEALRDPDVKNALAQEIVNGVRGRTPNSNLIDKIRANAKGANQGINSDSIESFGNADNVPTGFDRRYWEEGDDE